MITKARKILKIKATSNMMVEMRLIAKITSPPMQKIYFSNHRISTNLKKNKQKPTIRSR